MRYLPKVLLANFLVACGLFFVAVLVLAAAYILTTKEAPGGGYETALFQVFDEDLQVVGEWLHPEIDLPFEVKRQIHSIKNAADATRANPPRF